MSGVIVDLSVPLNDGAEGVRVGIPADPPVYLGQECLAWDLEIPSHTGTYFETPAHVFRGGTTTDEFAPQELILPGVCLRIHHGRRAIDARDLDEALGSISAGIPAGVWGLLVDVDVRAPGNHAYFTRDAAAWMADRGVRIMGSNTPLYDTGFEEPTGFFIDLFEAEIAIVANIANLGELPDRGFDLVVMPLSVAGVGTVPCRVVAIVNPT